MSEADAGWIPDEWLTFIDERSQAGPGHADRVARLTLVLADALPAEERELSATDLALAARMHELGRLSGPTANPAEMAVNGAALLAEAGYPELLARAVRHLHERWDGTGGPEGLAGEAIPCASVILSAADALDHYTGAWVRAGIEPAEAVRRALGLLEAQRGNAFGPAIASAVQRERHAVSDVLISQRMDESDTELLAPARRLA
jgi:response regulator RpfG family c-di-GMP phosphodiesterase